LQELTNHNISIVEDLTKQRQPFPGLDVIYLVDPTCVTGEDEDSMELICHDFDGPARWKEDKGEDWKPLYGQVHIFFISPVTESILNKLATSSIYDKIRTCSELNLAYTPIDAHAFTMSHLYSNDCLTDFYGDGCAALGDMGMESLVRQTETGLFTFLCSIGEKPRYIRWYHSGGPNAQLAEKVAEEIKQELNNTKVKFNEGANELTLLIIDRSFDLQTVRQCLCLPACLPD